MDASERQYAVCVNLSSIFIQVINQQSTYFVDQFMTNVIQPRKTIIFSEFFNDNWQLRHYGNACGDQTDSIA